MGGVLSHAQPHADFYLCACCSREGPRSGGKRLKLSPVSRLKIVAQGCGYHLVISPLFFLPLLCKVQLNLYYLLDNFPDFLLPLTQGSRSDSMTLAGSQSGRKWMGGSRSRLGLFDPSAPFSGTTEVVRGPGLEDLSWK